MKSAFTVMSRAHQLPFLQGDTSSNLAAT